MVLQHVKRQAHMLTVRKIRALKAVYGLDLVARDAHQLREAGADER
jgi:hypothetical protein